VTIIVFLQSGTPVYLNRKTIWLIQYLLLLILLLQAILLSKILGVTTMSRYFSLSCTTLCQYSMPIVFKSSVSPSIHFFLGHLHGRFPTGFHSKATRTGSYSFFLRIWPSYWIVWPLMMLVTGVRFWYSIICIMYNFWLCWINIYHRSKQDIFRFFGDSGNQSSKAGLSRSKRDVWSR